MNNLHSILLADFYGIFYWLTVADSVKKFFDAASNIFTVFAVISFIAFFITSIGRAVTVSSNDLQNEDEENKSPDARAWTLIRKFILRFFYPMLFLSIITWMGYVFVPTKKDCLLIVAGGAVGNFITHDSSAKAIPSDITRFLHLSLQEQMKDLNSDVKKELGMQTKKEEFVDKVKSLSKEELVKYIQNDTTFVK